MLALVLSLVTISVNAQEKKKIAQITNTKTTPRKLDKHILPPVIITGTVTYRKMMGLL